jgi:hypothetical protein
LSDDIALRALAFAPANRAALLVPEFGSHGRLSRWSDGLLALLILTVLAQEVADERSGGLAYVGSVFKEEVASGFDRDEARSAYPSRGWRHALVRGQAVVGRVNEKGGHPDVFEWERVGGRLGHDGVERDPQPLGATGKSDVRMAKKSGSRLASHPLGTPMMRASRVGQYCLSSHQPRSQPATERTSGWTDVGTVLAPMPGR